MSFAKILLTNILEKKKSINNKCDELITCFSCANSEVDELCNSDDFVDLMMVDSWYEKYHSLKEDTSDKSLRQFKRSNKNNLLKTQVKIFIDNYCFLENKLSQHNDIIAEKKTNDAYKLIGEVEGRQLDFQQMACIVKESHNHLVIAGAGTGKTTTVVGKIKYLLKSGKYKPEDILVLSFTNASAAEMKERIVKETGIPVYASTFHKLGLNIITKADGVKPKISQIELNTFIKNVLLNLMKNSDYLRALSEYVLYNRIPYKSEFEFITENEYKDYLRLNPPITLCGEHVKSYGEMDIANFLFQNGIKYVYEAEYKYDTRSSDYAQYYPDFYLPDYDIYIEFFGVDKNGEVPDWFTGKNGKTATETYRESMEWKFCTHKKNNTKMVAAYSYEKTDGTLLSNLEKNIKAQGVSLSTKSPEELWKSIAENDDSPLDGLINLFETVINLLKSNAYSMDYFRTLVHTKAQKKFVFLIRPVFDAYEAELKAKGEIDFNDMINLAAEYVRDGKVKNPFSYVIVDEYQDISKARYGLLSELRKSRDFSLFCVGDDWQSIYRFAGSDINYILDFNKYWGRTTISKIETTYRFSNSLIEISSGFITENPKQIYKQIKGKTSDKRFSLGEISGYTEKIAVDFMLSKLDDLPENASVFFIGRYSFDVKLLNDNNQFRCQYNNITGFTDIVYGSRSDLKMCFFTAHKSKGLQADYVFIINNKETRMGFPSKMQDDPIIGLLLENSESYPFAEERRLYYVAMTRAKVKAFILVQKDNESIFAKELHTKYANNLKDEQYECPVCGGRLLLKTGPYGDFFGCENYKRIGCTYKRKIRGPIEHKKNKCCQNIGQPTPNHHPSSRPATPTRPNNGPHRPGGGVTWCRFTTTMHGATRYHNN